MRSPKCSWLITCLDLSPAIRKTPTKHTWQLLLLGNFLCLLYLYFPSEIKMQRRAKCRAYCTLQKEKHATKPAFLVLCVTAVLGLDTVNKQTSD